MPYAVINKSGCDVRKGNIQLRLDFFLDEGDPRYEERYLNFVDTTSPEYLAGYPGKVDEEGNPVDQADYDKWYESLPRLWQNTPFHSHLVYFDADFTEEDIKAAIELHLPNFYKAFQEESDKDAGGMRRGWATETRIKPTDYSKIESASKYDARVSACQLAIDNVTAFSYKPTGDGESKLSPATEIDIGYGTVTGIGWSSGYTNICNHNSAQASGSIDTFEVYARDSMTGTNKVGTFYGSSTTYTNRDGATIGTVTSGAKRTFTGLAIDVSTGDFPGIYFSNGTGYARSQSGTSVYYTSGDRFGTGSRTYTAFSNYAFSMYGTGEGETLVADNRSAFFPFM